MFFDTLAAPSGADRGLSHTEAARTEQRWVVMPEGWTDVTEGYLEELYITIKKQKGQLSLALSILAALGFDIAEMVDAFML